MNLRRTLIVRLLVAVALLLACGNGALLAQGEGAERPALLPGDLLFFSADGGMGSAIKAATGNYTHVAIVERVADSIYIIEATRPEGVRRRALTEGGWVAYRLSVPFDTAAMLRRAAQRMGLPYDDAFAPGNAALYCSELVQECYVDSIGRPLFATHPMNWRDARGRLPRYWKRHFRRLGLPVPEGVEGTNPTDLSRDTLLREVR